MTNLQIILAGAWILAGVAWATPRVTGMGAFLTLGVAVFFSFLAMFTQ